MFWLIVLIWRGDVSLLSIIVGKLRKDVNSIMEPSHYGSNGCDYFSKNSEGWAWLEYFKSFHSAGTVCSEHGLSASLKLVPRFVEASIKCIEATWVWWCNTLAEWNGVFVRSSPKKSWWTWVCGIYGANGMLRSLTDTAWTFSWVHAAERATYSRVTGESN